ALISKTGGTTAVGSGTPLPEGKPGKGPGFVGTSYNQVIATSGRLFLGFNDNYVPFNFTDNARSFSTTITLCGQPDIAPTSLTWNPLQGGVDFSYQVTGTDLPQDTTAALYWASGPTLADAIGG